MSERPPIPLVELVRHYREFKSKRDPASVLVHGPYHSQAARKKLTERPAYPDELAGKLFRSVHEFSTYSNVGEPFIGSTRGDPTDVADIEQIVNGPKAAAYLAQPPGRKLTIEGVGNYIYVDREVEPARTTSGPRATMANHFDDGTPSTAAMSADLLLRSDPEGRPTIGEVKVSTAKGDDADPVYALVQALALAAQLAGGRQRERLRCWYPKDDFADKGPVDVLVFLFRMGEKVGPKTYWPDLVRLSGELCSRLDRQSLRPHVERVALIDVVVAPDRDRLRFTTSRHSRSGSEQRSASG